MIDSINVVNNGWPVLENGGARDVHVSHHSVSGEAIALYLRATSFDKERGFASMTT